MSIPGFTADTATYRGSGGYRPGHGAPARGRPGVLPQGRAARRASGPVMPGVCVRLCRNECRPFCRNPQSEQCRTCYSPCIDDCLGSSDEVGLF